jgi:hypothetical protein
MYNNIKEAKKAHVKGELKAEALFNLELYFQAVSKPAEDIYVLDDWCYDEDDNADLVTFHSPEKITRKEIYQRFSEKDLHGFTDLAHSDLIDCHGHILSDDEIREIFWNMGN